jgi:transcriptional regulator of acetoin/glycerol metabolism
MISRNPLPVDDEGSNEMATRSLGALGAFVDSQRTSILRALEATGWMIGGLRGAAARLGLKRTTLITKMRKFGISRPTCEENTDDSPDRHPHGR